MNAADDRFAHVRACVFDAYGTLFDVHSAVAKFRDEVGDRHAELSALWRIKQLELPSRTESVTSSPLTAPRASSR